MSDDDVRKFGKHNNLLNLPCEIINSIWIFVPWEMPKIHSTFQKMKLLEPVKCLYYTKFKNLIQTNLEYFFHSDWIGCTQLLNTVLLPNYKTENLLKGYQTENLLLEGYQKYMSQLSHRCASCLRILFGPNTNPFEIFTSNAHHLASDDRSHYAIIISRLFALACTFCGIIIDDVSIKCIVPVQFHVLFGNAMLTQRIRRNQIMRQYPLRMYGKRQEFQIISYGQYSIRNIVSIWCNPKMSWDIITIKNTQVCLKELHLIIQQPNLYELNVTSCGLGDTHAFVLSKWLREIGSKIKTMTDLEKIKHYSLDCKCNNISSENIKFLLQIVKTMKPFITLSFSF